MVKKLSTLSILIVVILSVYGLITNRFWTLIPYLLFILGITIFALALQERGKLRRNLFIMTGSLILTGIMRLLSN